MERSAGLRRGHRRELLRRIDGDHQAQLYGDAMREVVEASHGPKR